MCGEPVGAAEVALVTVDRDAFRAEGQAAECAGDAVQFVSLGALSNGVLEAALFDRLEATLAPFAGDHVRDCVALKGIRRFEPGKTPGQEGVEGFLGFD